MSKKRENPKPSKFIDYFSLTQHLTLLGFKVRDKVTKVEGVVTSICFDLYGCIQACIDRGVDKEGKQLASGWYDIARIKIIGKTPVMEPPNFENIPASHGKKGPADKPGKI